MDLELWLKKNTLKENRKFCQHLIVKGSFFCLFFLKDVDLLLRLTLTREKKKKRWSFTYPGKERAQNFSRLFWRQEQPSEVSSALGSPVEMLRPWITPPRPSEVTGGIAEKDESSVKEASWGLKGKLLYISGLANDYSAPTPLLTLLTSGKARDCPGAVCWPTCT